MNLVCNINKHSLKGQRCLYECNQLYDELGGGKENKQKTFIDLKRIFRSCWKKFCPGSWAFISFFYKCHGEITGTVDKLKELYRDVTHREITKQMCGCLCCLSLFFPFFFSCGYTDLVKDFHLISILFMELLLLIKLYLIFQRCTSSSVFIGTDFPVQHLVTEWCWKSWSRHLSGTLKKYLTI